MPTVLTTRPTVTHELSSLITAAVIIASRPTHPQRDGQAEWVWMKYSCTKTVYPTTVTHLSTNPAQRRVTLLIRPVALPPSKTATVPPESSKHVTHIMSVLNIMDWTG